MRSVSFSVTVALLFFTTSCHDKPASEDTTARNTRKAALPPDVITITKPLIKGMLYKEAGFEEGSLISFDTSQQIMVLDTTDALFIKARITKDTASYTGFVLKAILPE